MLQTTAKGLPPGTICVNCGVPVDSQHFDETGFADVPEPGRRIVLARFSLPPQYCGVLEFFAQYTDAFGKSAAAIETPTVEWLLTMNDRPVYPYVNISAVLNPWGFGSFATKLRLDEGATVEFSVRGSLAGTNPPDVIQRVGGRIAGHYWYNPVYGDPVRKRF